MGPIFGAIMGVVYGPSAFLWITFGTIFGGAVHDYFSGMMSIRSNGASLPDLIGQHLGKTVKWIMLVFMFCLLVQVGAVFVKGPAELLVSITPDYMGLNFFIIVIFSYYMLATLLPIDKIIGKLYPYFAVALMFMVIGVLVALIWHWPSINEVYDGIGNMNPQKETMPIFPMMFISIACGAVSGFHATQSPLVARCIKNERYGRRIFYGAMVVEGVIALVWAAAAIGFFHSVEGLQDYLGTHGNNAAIVVNTITHTWLGKFGAVLAMLGVIVAPITSGDTALRSCRLMVADMFKWDQKPIWTRLAISIPIFLIVIVLLNVDFKILWRYFAWSNQTLSVFTFWTITIYLWKKNKFYWISLVPALFMTMVC
jgi:carbon starvation protein CstA